MVVVGIRSLAAIGNCPGRCNLLHPCNPGGGGRKQRVGELLKEMVHDLGALGQGWPDLVSGIHAR